MVPSAWPVQVAFRTGSYQDTSPGEAAWAAARSREVRRAIVAVFMSRSTGSCEMILKVVSWRWHSDLCAASGTASVGCGCAEMILPTLGDGKCLQIFILLLIPSGTKPTSFHSSVVVLRAVPETTTPYIHHSPD
jgi:hypothetical protein